MKDLNYKSYHQCSHHPYHMAPQNSDNPQNQLNPSSFNYHQTQRHSLTSFNNGFPSNREPHHHNHFQQNNHNYFNNNNNQQRTHHRQLQPQLQSQPQRTPTTHSSSQSCYQQRQDQQYQQNQQMSSIVPATNQLNIYTNNFFNYNLATSSATDSSTMCSSIQQQSLTRSPSSLSYNLYSPQNINNNSDITITKKNNNNRYELNFPNNNNKNYNYNNNYIDLPYALSNEFKAEQNPQTTLVTNNNINLFNNEKEKKNIGATNDKFPMDAIEIANFLANELFVQQPLLEGMQSVPTITTPTLTPTTLRTIDESLLEMIDNEANNPFQAGFKPPPIHPNNEFGYNYADVNETATDDDSQGSWLQNNNDESSQATTDNSSAATETTSLQNGTNGMGNNSLTTSSTTNDFTNVNFGIPPAAVNAFGIETSSGRTTSNRRSGGRRPAQQSNLSPEEEEKRRQRRERNKLAAARCRKRRVDQTNELQAEVDKYEKIREELKKEVERLNNERCKLQDQIDNHKPTCRKMEKNIMAVHSFNGFISPAVSNVNTGLETNLASIANRSDSPIDFKTAFANDDILSQIKNEPEDLNLDNTSLDGAEGPPSPKRAMMIPPLPNVLTLQPFGQTLNTPVLQTPTTSFGSLPINPTLNALNKPVVGIKARPNTLPSMPRSTNQSLILSVTGKQQTEIHGVPIQTPSTGTFNFDSLMDGGTGLTPVTAPLIPTCSSQNKIPMDTSTPTSEPSKLVSL